jgi:hypothetical protein
MAGMGVDRLEAAKMGKTFPLQDQRLGEVSEGVHMAAYEVYSHVYSPQQALIEGSARGGFATAELIAFLYARAFPRCEWKARVDEAYQKQARRVT